MADKSSSSSYHPAGDRDAERSDRDAERSDRDAERSAASSSRPGKLANGGASPPPEEVCSLSFNPRINPDGVTLPEPVTSSDEALMKKHDPKLAESWAIWEHHVLTKDKAYADATKLATSVSTVKEFWGCWNHLPQPSTLLEGKRFYRQSSGSRTLVDALCIFRKGIAPEWEHPENTKGGHFMLSLKPQIGAALIDELWNNVVLAIIGEAISPADMVCGARLVDKLGNTKGAKHVRIELWFNDMDRDETGRLYDLRGNFERCLVTGLDGAQKAPTWGYTEVVPHSKAAEDEGGGAQRGAGGRGGR